MSRKIPVSAPQNPLQSPFAALQMDGLPEGQEITPEPAPEKVDTKRHRIVLRKEKAQRGGKTVIVVSQLPTHLSPPELENLLKAARKSLGCGGALNGRELEIQGDQAARVRTFFEGQGFVVGGVS